MSHTVLTKFPADLPDMVFECFIRANIVLCLPCAFKEFFFCHDFPNVIHEELQDIKLFRSQAKILSIQKGFPDSKIEFQAEFGNLNHGVFSGIGA